ncbi:MAG: hypothetical protein M9958_01055 [Chitinophagales bacterium]|nr:hypothetical protein [Chitinophagales bacterium]
MEYVLLIGYSALFLSFVYFSKRFYTPSISNKIWTSLAFIKICAALLYSWLNTQIPTFYDSSFYFREGEIVYSALNENPFYYLQLLIGPNNYFPEPEHLCTYIDQLGLWYDFTGYTIVRVNAFFRLFSAGFISVHFLLFSFLSFIGAFYLFKFFERETTLSEYLIVFGIFLIPGTLLWTSGLHKDALVVFAIGILLYNFERVTTYFSWFRFFWVLIAFLLLVNVRGYLVLAVLPALGAYYWDKKSNVKAVVPYVTILVVMIAVVLVYDCIIPDGYRLANKINIIQKSFLNADGNTSFEIEAIRNSWWSMISAFPSNFLNAFIYPMYNQCYNDWCRLASVESILLCLFIILGFVKVKFKYIFDNSIALFSLSLGFYLMAIIGLVVNNSGAIVRYRSVAVLFIFIGFLISFQKTSKLK